ncbi:type II toxin-antitoxin system PemK/MazF family toxin (plasmid) [Bernardetia sp. Wsw4-3y2]|uniref:type II toxin-antitoxin system PemK/MazF family toxin n=1 Tax=Bernardetia sp. Wsw4-3y2 TaxID=3127471 RepID=UPI0030CE02F4
MKKRGEIWWVNFDPSVGQEIKKKRPAVIVSNNISNRFLKRYQVVPLSSNVTKIYPAEVKVKFENKESKALADQITTASEKRFVNKIGVLDTEEMKKIEKILKSQLGLK